MVAVTLCVAMMMIVISVMNGFLSKIESAAKGLFGDIVISGGGLDGLAYYDEFIREIPKAVPEVEAASPFILTYGIIRVPEWDMRQTVQLAGIRLPERANVSEFRKGLFVQNDWKEPTFNPPIDAMLQRIMKNHDTDSNVVDRLLKGDKGTPPTPEQKVTASGVLYALDCQRRAMDVLLRARDYEANARAVQEKLDRFNSLPAAQRDPNVLDELKEQQIQIARASGYRPAEDHLILSLGLRDFSFRTPEGETIRRICPGRTVDVTLIPLGRQLSMTDVSPVKRLFTVVDDCRTDVSTIDNSMVYLPFETLQRLNNMDGEGGSPGRCTQIHLKVKDSLGDEASLRKVREKVDRFWRTDFVKRYEQAEPRGGGVLINTWREQQSHIVSNIERQRTLVVTMFGIISLVAVVLIVVIFYVIVVQKTKDIGVIKAVGGSSWGVAQIFLMYGSFVGLVGSALGIVAGAMFVHWINEIQDWLDAVFGFRVWNREWFLFDKIPNQVDWSAAGLIVVSAILAGLAGAMIPAIRAARMQPVETLRYE